MRHDSGNCFEMWWPGTELNRRRQPFQGCALPPELPGHFPFPRADCEMVRFAPACGGKHVNQLPEALGTPTIITITRHSLNATARIVRYKDLKQNSGPRRCSIRCGTWPPRRRVDSTVRYAKYALDLPRADQKCRSIPFYTESAVTVSSVRSAACASSELSFSITSNASAT